MTQVINTTLEIGNAIHQTYFDFDEERVMVFETANDAITGVHVLINPEKLRHLAASLGTEPAWETPFPLPRRAQGTI